MKKTQKIIAYLKKKYPKSVTALGRLEDPFEVLISTILSQRTNDDVTYPASRRLFKRYSGPGKLASAPLREIEKLIVPVNFYKTKAKRVKEVAGIIEKEYKGRVPEDIETLVKLPGVGIKTADCVLVYAHGIPTIPVDTHVNRISKRLGLVPKSLKTEKVGNELKKIFQKKDWCLVNDLFVNFGRDVCRPIGPKCPECGLRSICTYYRTPDRS